MPKIGIIIDNLNARIMASSSVPCYFSFCGSTRDQSLLTLFDTRNLLGIIVTILNYTGMRHSFIRGVYYCMYV